MCEVRRQSGTLLKGGSNMSLMKKAIGGSIHRIREFELEKVNLGDEFDILQIVGEGWFGKILLTEHRSTQTEMVLKALPKPYTSISDFYREFHYGLHLSAHRNIITTYDVAFETAGFYVFSQEYAPLGDLTSNVTETGLGELHAKRVARQLAAAVHHIHSRELVHRDIKLDNILVFKSDFSRIKLCDFGETRRVSTVVRRHNEWLPYSPPEVLQIDTDETYKALTAHDVWQFGIVLFVCLTGCLPWQKAAPDDPRYARYQNWHSAPLNIAKKPKLFQLISSRAQRMFKRLLDPKTEKRPVSVFEVNKYLEDRWLAKIGAEKALNGGADERDELCPSMYSFHSSVEEKNQLLFTLTQYGIETTVDRSKKKDRIREWIQSSAIMEENEDEESDEAFTEEEEEELNMRGKHFPARRESARKPESLGIPLRTWTEAPKNGTPKAPGRRNPFAPQVAEERQALAQSASFPNGDPNLAARLHGERITAVPVIPNDRSRNGQAHGEPIKRTSPPQSVKILSTAKTGSSNAASKRKGFSDAGKIPNGTAVNHSSLDSSLNNSFTSPSSSVSTFSPNSSLSNTFSPNGSLNSTFSPSSGLKSPLDRDALEETGADLVDAMKREMQYKPGSPKVPARRSRAQTTTLPTEVNPKSPLPRRSHTTVLPAVTTGSVLQAMNPLTMSVASQLVMQSFNSLQAMNVALPKVPGEQSDVVGDGEERTVEEAERRRNAYGKDAYEHYGIAQGVVLRVAAEGTRNRGSTGSGSRSVSN